MITSVNAVGRLCEVRMVSPIPLDEVAGLGRDLKAATSRHGKIVVAGDLRGCKVFPPDVYDALVRMLKADNPGLERSALLLPPSATFTLQLERLVRDGGNPQRRTFTEVASLCEWLGCVLTDAEQAALARFAE